MSLEKSESNPNVSFPSWRTGPQFSLGRCGMLISSVMTVVQFISLLLLLEIN